MHFIYLILLLIALPFQSGARAQSGIEIPLSHPIHVIDSTHIKQQGMIYHLWGTQASLDQQAASDAQPAVEFLTRLIGRGDLTCFVYEHGDDVSQAQCFNDQSVDLSLSVIQSGLAFADRSAVVGTTYETPYIQAEQAAQDARSGLWASSNAQSQVLRDMKHDIAHLTRFSFILFIITLVAIAITIFLNKVAFDRIHLILNQTMQLLSNEAKLRKREQDLTAVMINSELKTNQSKIDAYLVIYEDLLDTLNDPYADHRYLRSGEVVRSAPGMERSIYDANTYRMDALGEDLIARVVDFYSRVETDPPYNNLTPDMTHETAVDIVTQAVKNARSLKNDLEDILEIFKNKGFVSINLMLSN